jgi:hypothetical protein
MIIDDHPSYILRVGKYLSWASLSVTFWYRVHTTEVSSNGRKATDTVSDTSPSNRTFAFFTGPLVSSKNIHDILKHHDSVSTSGAILCSGIVCSLALGQRSKLPIGHNHQTRTLQGNHESDVDLLSPRNKHNPTCRTCGQTQGKKVQRHGACTWARCPRTTCLD